MLVPKPSMGNKDKEALLSLTLCKEDKLRLSCLENKRLDAKGLRKEELLVGGFFFNKEETPLVNSFLEVGSKEKTEKNKPDC
jgi:hypothetical protein